MKLPALFMGFLDTYWIFKIVQNVIDEKRCPYWQRLYWAQTRHVRFDFEVITAALYAYLFPKGLQTVPVVI